MGDFNDIICFIEKRGRVPHPTWLIEDFCNALADCSLQDIPLKGYPFTWERNRATDRVVEEILDQAMVGASWLNMFPHDELRNLVVAVSNHSSIEINMEVKMCSFRR